MKISIYLEDSQELQAYAKRLGLKHLSFAALRLVSIGLHRSKALRTYTQSHKGRQSKKRYEERAAQKGKQRMQNESRLALHRKSTK